MLRSALAEPAALGAVTSVAGVAIGGVVSIALRGVISLLGGMLPVELPASPNHSAIIWSSSEESG